MIFCLLSFTRKLSTKGSTLTGKNLLIEEQILACKS